MTQRELPWIVLRSAGGGCALLVSIHGLWNIYGLDFRIDTLSSILYCLLPFLSFFVFLFVKPAKLEISLHALIAVGYLAVYSFLNWRTCTAFGYCSTVTATVSTTLMTSSVVAALVVLILSATSRFLGCRQAAKPASRPAN